MSRESCGPACPPQPRLPPPLPCLPQSRALKNLGLNIRKAKLAGSGQGSIFYITDAATSEKVGACGAWGRATPPEALCGWGGGRAGSQAQ